MSITSVTEDEKQKGVAALLAYNAMQKDGATTSTPPEVADLVIESELAKKYGQTKTSLHLPVNKLNPTLSADGSAMEQVVFAQLGDNGVLPIFLAVAKMIAGKTLDTKWAVTTRTRYSVSVAEGATKITMSGTGLFPHSANGTTSGVPVDSDKTATYVEIIDPTTNAPMTNGDGRRIFGRTKVGTSTSPNSVEIELLTHAMGADPEGSSTAYAWESGKPATVNLAYGYRQRLDELDGNAFRRVFR